MDLLRGLSESRLLPSVHDLGRYDAEEVARLGCMVLVGLRILSADPEFEGWAAGYSRRTARHGDFRRWRHDATDLYALLHALTDRDVTLRDPNFSGPFRTALHVDDRLILQWLRGEARDLSQEPTTRKLFARLDQMFRLADSGLRAVRRLAMDWPTLPPHERRMVMTRLLQFFRVRAPRAEIRHHLERMAASRSLEITGAEDAEAAPKPKGFLASLVDESASAGATSAASVAVSVGGLGAGFDDDYSKSIYGQQKKPKPKPRKPTVVRR